MKKLRSKGKPAKAHDLGLHSRPTQIADALADAYGYPLMGSCLGVIWEQGRELFLNESLSL
jgi:hypothetical protein